MISSVSGYQDSRRWFFLVHMMRKCETSLTILFSNRCLMCVGIMYGYFSGVLNATLLSAEDKMCENAKVEKNNKVVNGDEEVLETTKTP